jgi:threonylcarbamoyladenosine tRNA methylthiotransferase MtaB
MSNSSASNQQNTQQPPAPRTFAVATLGCKVNQADSDAISEQFRAAGFEQCDFTGRADVYVVNTCTVTHLGDRSSRQMISQARRRAPDALLVVTGCYAEIAPQTVAALPGVDLVIGNVGKDGLVERVLDQVAASAAPAAEPQTEPLAPAAPAITRRQRPLLDVLNMHTGSDAGLDAEALAENASVTDLAPLAPSPFSRTRVQMKVQDGCDNRCTYCIVPTVRGASRSRSMASILEHTRRKAAAGYQEIVLTGIHLGDYHAPEGGDLGDLMAALLEKTEIRRIRVSSLEPEDFNLDWLALWRNPRMCRHLHLPLQSGSDQVLRKMARRYNSARYRTIIETARRLVPEIAITTDMIAGFPGETDADAEMSYRFAQEMRFAKIHVFRFSPRQGTAAARMRNQIPDKVKKARSEQLLELQAADGSAFRQQFLGRTVEVLWEEPRPTGWEGLTDNYLRVELVPDSATEVGDLHNAVSRVRLTDVTEDGLMGVLA